MKAHTSPSAMTTRKQREVIRAGVEQEMQKQTVGLSRRILKLVCVALHEEFGFGKDRLCRMAAMVNQLGEDAKTDTVFWAHVDKILNEEIGMQFEPEDWKEGFE